MRERTVPAARSTHPERMSSFLRLNQNSKINGAVISGHYCPQIVNNARSLGSVIIMHQISPILRDTLSSESPYLT